jgi:peptidoglycan/xylan/chitin deacetylase (PgdA/CDA1 family)
MRLIKKMIKFSLSVVVYWSGLLSLFAFLKRIFFPYGDLVILMYHSVLDFGEEERECLQPGLIVSQQVFDRQMSFLARNHNLLSLEQLIGILKNNKPIPKRTVVITFDDGWRDNYLYAYPILKKHKVPATIFLSTDFVDTHKMFWFLQVKLLLAEGNFPLRKLAGVLKKVKEENKTSLSAQSLNSLDIDSIGGDADNFIEKMKRLDFEVIQEIIDDMITEGGVLSDKWTKKRWVLSWDEVMEMSQNNIDFGSHGCSHRILTTLNLDEVKQELIVSKKIIEEEIGKKVHLFSYPNGDYNSEVKKLVQEAAYRCAVTIKGCEEKEKEPDLFALRRIGVHEDMSTDLKGKFSEALFASNINGWNNFLKKSHKS